MSTLSKFTLRLVAASVIALVPAGASLADPPDMLITPGPHQHFLATPSGNEVSIGPEACDPDLQQAYNQFHYNVHRSASSPTNPVETLGPQHGAPGLHDGLGAEMAIVGGCP